MKNETLVIRKRGEDGSRVITVRIKEDTLGDHRAENRETALFTVPLVIYQYIDWSGASAD